MMIEMKAVVCDLGYRERTDFVTLFFAAEDEEGNIFSYAGEEVGLEDPSPVWETTDPTPELRSALTEEFGEELITDSFWEELMNHFEETSILSKEIMLRKLREPILEIYIEHFPTEDKEIKWVI